MDFIPIISTANFKINDRVFEALANECQRNVKEMQALAKDPNGSGVEFDRLYLTNETLLDCLKQLTAEKYSYDPAEGI